MSKLYKAPAKVNLTLKVTGRRADGYHELCSVFQKISLCDRLSIEAAETGGIEIASDKAGIPLDGSNLAVRAATALGRAADVSAGARIIIEKNIPVAAGLGGGSSDAATALMALNEMWGCGLSSEELARVALEVGADVPFFLGGPASLAQGVGERLTSLAPQREVDLLLVNPGFPIRAADAYKNSRFDFDPAGDIAGIIADIESGEPERVAGRVGNDLEPWALETFAQLRELKNRMENADPPPLKVAMSGSGPTMFAVYQDADACQRAEKDLSGKYPFVKVANTLNR